ncbi:MAG: hypothetical protein LBV41_07550 [Cytophagaceae bacterium]|jgi:hypothetical protein|nr:hypothetical protein [Cytophagaceae bacterium]
MFVKIKKMTFVLAGMFISLASMAQQNGEELSAIEKLEQRVETLNKTVQTQQKLKVSGVIQTQFQHGEKDAALNVGAANNSEEAFNRVGVRRGFVKFAFDEKIVSSVLQIDITEKGVSVKEVYMDFRIPKMGASAIRAGLFNRPFGYEVGYSSSILESPERANIIRTLLPDERDLGGMLILQPAKSSRWNFIKLETGLFAGNGIKQETDSRKDFIGRLSGIKNGSGFGISYYNGGVYQGTDSVYTMKGNAFVLNNTPSNRGKFAKREYIGWDAQWKHTSSLGTTKLHAEYILGTQSGAAASSKSPNTSTLPSTHTYVRKFMGGYVMLVQNIGKLPLSVIAKLEWYDPNIAVAKNETGQNGTGRGDLLYEAIGLGLMWHFSESVRLQAHYELNRNETTEHLVGYSKNLKDNVLTVRLQYRF